MQCRKVFNSWHWKWQHSDLDAGDGDSSGGTATSVEQRHRQGCSEASLHGPHCLWAIFKSSRLLCRPK
jgi:hypothetical protein